MTESNFIALAQIIKEIVFGKYNSTAIPLLGKL